MMDITIVQEKKAPLLQRKELVAHIPHPGGATPKQADIQKAIAQHYKVDEQLVLVEHIVDGYGSTKAEVTASVYDTLDAYKKFGMIAKKPKKKEEEKPAAAPAKK